jgi:hypothetical protein
MYGTGMAYIEFSLPSVDQFESLKRVFSALKNAKQEDDFPEDTYWLGFFDDQARSMFSWLTKLETDAAIQRWRESNHDPKFIPGWDFGSWIDAVRDGEYILKSCEQINRNTGRLVFEPFAWPFGGTDALHMLLKAFGCIIIADSEGDPF